MSKANQKAKFSVFNFFDVKLATKLERQIAYLDYDEIIARIPQVQQALQEIKARKRDEKSIIKMTRHNQKAKGRDIVLKYIPIGKGQRISNQIQHGFNIAEKWKDENKTKNNR